MWKFRLLKPGSYLSVVRGLNPFSFKKSIFRCLQTVLECPKASGFKLAISLSLGDSSESMG